MECDNFSLAKYHKNYSRALHEIVKRQPQALVESNATVEARKLYNQHRQVGTEIHLMQSYLRLDSSKHGILYTEFQPEHQIEKFVAKFFHTRFPQFVIVIASQRGVFIVRNKRISISNKTIREVIPDLEKELPINPIASEIEDLSTKDVWQKYYNSQFLKARENKKYFLSSIPKKFHKMESLNEEAFQYTKSKKLADFF